MPIKAWVLVLHGPHHIVQRGHNRQVVFLADEDYPFYPGKSGWELSFMRGA